MAMKSTRLLLLASVLAITVPAQGKPLQHRYSGSKLLQTLIAADLVDEYRMCVFPVVLGEGKRLFENGVPPRGLTLIETRSTPRGVLVNTYYAAGPLPRG
jgi:RibD C-terminal domain